MHEPRIQMKGREFDVLTDWVKVDTWRAGQRKAIKRQYRRRLRKVLRQRTREEGELHEEEASNARRVDRSILPGLGANEPTTRHGR